MLVRDNDEWGDSFLFSFVVVNVICLDSEKVLGCKMICRTRSEMNVILMRSRSQDYCTERSTSTIIGWCWFFIFSLCFWISHKNVFIGSLVLNWRWGWQWFGYNDFLLHPMRWCWLWDWHPLIWSRRQDWWHYHPLRFHRKVHRWKSRSWSKIWRNNSGIFGGSSEDFCYFDKFIFGSIIIFQWWYN